MDLKEFDKSFLSSSVKVIAGVDEAGRGPLAGPVVAAVTIFDVNTIIPKINDSKKLSEKIREELYDEIISQAISYGIGIVHQKEIDEINILQATLKAMQLAVAELKTTPDLILIDGNKAFNSNIPTQTIVKGDSKSFSIAAASILAKVTRDRIMVAESKKHPEYLWSKNKGYGTKEHIQAIKKHGATKLHRKSFLRNILEHQEELKI
ncbi:MAG: ribonuclease HII [Melioribacteraceae bacterium]|jgi:ribonuclease HII|nr:ribonuclease HII [Melioribacteraceae bacterium]